MGKILKMAYDTSGMADYAKSNGDEIIRDLIVKAQSFDQDGIRIEEGIKSTKKVADIAVGSTVLQDTNGDPGSLPYSGGTTLADINLAVSEITVKEKYVTGQLNSKIAQMQMKSGSDPSNPLPYTDVLVELKGDDVALKNDIILWQGSTATGNTNGNTNKFDGWLTQALAGASVSGGTNAALVPSTAIATVDSIRLVAETAFPAWVSTGSFMSMSPSQFSVIYRAIHGLGSAIDNQTLATGKPVAEFYLPGTNMLVQSCVGLVGKTNIFVTRTDNKILNTDLVSEDDVLNFEYLNEALIWRLMANYKLGAKIARIGEVVVTK